MAVTQEWEVRAVFSTREEALAFKELTAGLVPGGLIRVQQIEDKRGRQPVGATRLGRLVLKWFGERGRSATLDDVEAMLEEHDWRASSASSVCYKLVACGLLTKVRESTYELPRNGEKHSVGTAG